MKPFNIMRIVCAISLLLLVSRCGKSIIYTYDTGQIKEVQFYKRKKLVSFKRYKPDGALEREVFYNGKANPDSTLSYVQGYLNRKDYYADGKIVESFFYWSNGNYKTIYEIDKVDTIERKDSFGEEQEFVAYTGRQITYYENGKIHEKGDLIKGERCGVWLSYDSLGLTKNDTLRCAE